LTAIVIFFGFLLSEVYKIAFPVLIFAFPAYFQFKFRPISVAAKLCMASNTERAIPKIIPFPLIFSPLFFLRIFLYSKGINLKVSVIRILEGAALYNRLSITVLLQFSYRRNRETTNQRSTIPPKMIL